MTTDLNNSSTVLTGARQTMASWARVIESYAELPEIYREAFTASLGDSPTFPYVVLAPVPTLVRHKTAEKLLYLTDDTLHVLARTGNELVAQAYPLSTICTFEIGIILLYLSLIHI